MRKASDKFIFPQKENGYLFNMKIVNIFNVLDKTFFDQSNIYQDNFLPSSSIATFKRKYKA